VSQPEDARDAGSGNGGEDEVAPTPFDNPFFLPVILIGFAIWFIYDGWFNPDMEWIRFNRTGAVITSLLGAWYTWRAVQERRRGPESSPGGEQSPGPQA
jgi:hypothetical protein